MPNGKAEDEMTYGVSCENGHEYELNASELEDILWSHEFGCRQCDSPLTLQTSLSLVCQACHGPWDDVDLEEAASILETECGHCERMGFTGYSFHVPNSWHMHMAEYAWVRNGRSPEKLKRKDRSDYWEGLVHFCKVDEFVSICRDNTIKAGPTGYFNLPAVCLTEAPIGSWDELQDRHGRFGFVFSKREIIKNGGGPALYMSEKLIRSQNRTRGFADALKPFVNLLRIPSATPKKKKHDYLHEREWRAPQDIELDTILPEGLIIDWTEFTYKTPGWRHALDTLLQFEELDKE